MTEEYKVGLTVDYDQFLARINAAVATLEASSTVMTNAIQKMSNNIDSGMNKAAVATTSSVIRMEQSLNHMKGTITNIGAAVQSLQNIFVRLGSLLAGGAMFKEQVDASISWLDSIKRMKEQLGITAEEASVLQVALHKVGLSSEEYVGVATKISRQIANNSKEFAHFGIETKNLDGTWKNGQVLISEIVTEMGRYAEGTSRQIALTDLMKRSQIDLSKYLRLTAEFMAEEKKKAEELNLVFGNDKLAAMRSYKDAMADFNLVMESASLNIMPTLLAGLTNFAVLLTRIPKYLKDAWNAHKELWEVILSLIAAYAIYTAWVWAAETACITYTVVTVGVQRAVAFLSVLVKFLSLDFATLTAAEIIACGGWVVLAIGAIATAFFGWRAVVNFVIDAFLRLWNVMQQCFYMAKAVGLAMTGDLAGAGEAWDQSIKIGVEKLGIGEDHVANIEKKIKGMFELPKGGPSASGGSGENLTAPTREKGGGGSPYSIAKTGFQEALAKAELDADLANEKLGFDKKLALYHQYLDAVVKTEKEQHEFMVGLYHLESDAKKDQLEMDKAALEKEIAEGKAKTEEAYKRKIVLLQKEVELTKTGSKERIEAEIKVVNAIKEHEKAMQDLAKVRTEGLRAAALAEIDMQDEKYKMLLDYGQINEEQYDKMMLSHEETRYNIKLQALRDIQATEKDDMIKWEQTQNQIDELTAKHMITRLQLNDKLYKDQNAVMLDFKNKFQSSLDGMFQDIMKGTFNLTKFIGKLADDLLSSLTKKLSKQATDSLFGGLLGGGKEGQKEVTQEQTKQTAITAVVTAGNTARTLATKTGMIAAAAAGGAAATAMINANQAAFMATLQMIQSMGAAIGSIQPEGPLIAAGITTGVAAAQAQLSAAAATAQGSIQASYAVIGSASGGAEIGYDRLLQVHKEELVLPAAISGGLKNMIQAFNNVTNQVHVPVAVNGGGFSPGFAGSVRAGIEDVVMGILQREANR